MNLTIISIRASRHVGRFVRHVDHVKRDHGSSNGTAHLLERRGDIVTPEVLAFASASSSRGIVSRQLVETHVSRLRRTLRWAGTGGVIRTVRKVSYTIR